MDFVKEIKRYCFLIQAAICGVAHCRWLPEQIWRTNGDQFLTSLSRKGLRVSKS